MGRGYRPTALPPYRLSSPRLLGQQLLISDPLAFLSLPGPQGRVADGAAGWTAFDHQSYGRVAHPTLRIVGNRAQIP